MLRIAKLSSELPSLAVSSRRLLREGELVAPPLFMPAADYMRILASVGLVYFHAFRGVSNVIGATSLGVFLLLSYVHLARPINLRIYLKRACRRLMVTWLAWWFIYLVARIWIERGYSGVFASTNILQILTWPAFHLWYVPFILITTVLILAIRPIVKVIPVGWRWIVASMVGVLTMVSIPLSAVILPSMPILIYVLPSAGFGLAYSYAMRYKSGGRIKRFVAISLVMVFADLLTWRLGLVDEVALAYLFCALIILPCAFKVERPAWVARLSVMTLGVYLMHPFCFRIVDKLYTLFSLEAGPYDHFLAGTVGATFLTLILRRVPYFRILV